MDLQKQFGIAIRKIRNDMGISQEKFALMINMDRTYYASVEAGNRNISINNIGKIANGFNLSLLELFKVVDGICENEIEVKYHENV